MRKLREWMSNRKTREPGHEEVSQDIDPDQCTEQIRAIEYLLGARSPVPFVARWYLEQTRLAQLADDNLDEETKQQLTESGPQCTPEDEAYMQLSGDEMEEHLKRIAEQQPEHPDHAAIAGWVAKEPPSEPKLWLV